MTKYTYLQKRRGVYYIRVGIPKELQNILKKSEISYSLKTKDYRDAVRKLRVEILKVDKMFEDGKNNLHILTKAELISIIKYRMSGIYWDSKTFTAIQILFPEFDRYAKDCLNLPSDMNFDKTTDIWQIYHNTMLEMNDCIKDIQDDIDNGNSGVDAYCKLNDIVEKLSFIKEENTTIIPQSISLNTPKTKHKWQDVFEEFWIKKTNENPDIRDNAKSEYLSKLDTIFSLLKIEYVDELTENLCIDFVDKEIYKIPKRKNRDNKKWLKVNDTDNEDRLSQKTIMTYKNTLKQFLAYS